MAFRWRHSGAMDRAPFVDLLRRELAVAAVVSSVAGIQGVPYIANYSATMAYTLSLGEAVRLELSQTALP